MNHFCSSTSCSLRGVPCISGVCAENNWKILCQTDKKWIDLYNQLSRYCIVILKNWHFETVPFSVIQEQAEQVVLDVTERIVRRVDLSDYSDSRLVATFKTACKRQIIDLKRSAICQSEHKAIYEYLHERFYSAQEGY